MGIRNFRRVHSTGAAALLGAAVASGAAAQTYNAGQEAARRAAEQAAQAQARAAAAALAQEQQRAQREQADAERRRQQQPQSTYTPSGSSGQGSSRDSGSGSVPPSDRSLRLTDYSKWQKGSDYRRNVDMNPRAGTGTLDDWQYEVRHDASGKYVYGKATTTATDPRNGARLKLVLSCDLRSRVAEERDGKVYGPMAIEIDHRLVTQGRVPSGIGFGSKNWSVLGLAWERGPEVSRAREKMYESLTLKIGQKITDRDLMVNIGEGGAVDRYGTFSGRQIVAEAPISNNGFEQAFEKLAPCWDLNWYSWPVVKASPPLAAAPAPAVAAAPARPFIVPPLAPPTSPVIAPQPVKAYQLPPAEMEKIPALLAKISKPSAVYCSDGLCLGDDAAKVLQHPWATDSKVDFVALLRQVESAGQHCRPGRYLMGKRILADGRRQVITIGYRPGPSPIYVQSIATVYPDPLDDQQRLEMLQKERERWPALGGDLKAWGTTLHDADAGVIFRLSRPWFDYFDPGRKTPIDGVMSYLALTGPLQTYRYMLASQSGCPPGIDWRD